MTYYSRVPLNIYFALADLILNFLELDDFGENSKLYILKSAFATTLDVVHKLLQLAVSPEKSSKMVLYFKFVCS